jgi:SulP family sulfate permease
VTWRLPILRWQDEWRQPGGLRADLLAGLTGAVVVLPQGVAFATLAGMPPQYGLYAAMVPCIVAALFGSSRLMRRVRFVAGKVESIETLGHGTAR